MQQRLRLPQLSSSLKTVYESEPECLFLLRRLRQELPAVYRDSVRIAEYVLQLSQALGDLKTEQERLYRSALLHDIGIIQIEEGDSADHAKAYMQHPQLAAKLLKPLIAKDKVDQAAIEQHHENLDGSGFPYGRKEKAISRNARIVRIAVSFAKMTELDARTGRIVGAKGALDELFRWGGIIFDEDLVERAYSLWLS